MACSNKPWVSTRTCRFLPLIFFPASYPCGSIEAPLFLRSSRSAHQVLLRSGSLVARPAHGISHITRDAVAPACRPRSSVRDNRAPCAAAAGPSEWRAIGSRCSARTSLRSPPGGYRRSACSRRAWREGLMVPPRPIRRRSDRFHSAVGCGRFMRGSLWSTSSPPNRCLGVENRRRFNSSRAIR